SRPDLDEAPPGNSRTSLRHNEMADGPPPVPGIRIAKSESRTGPGRAELQSQTGNRHPRSAGAAPSASALPSLRRIFAAQQTPLCPSVAKDATSHTAWFAGTTRRGDGACYAP